MDVRTRPDGLTVINDSYNANPDSMRAGIDALAHAASTRTGMESWAVLGQMAELGEDAVGEHTGIGAYLAERGIDRLIVVGHGVNQDALAAAGEDNGIRTRQVDDVDGAVNLLTGAPTHPGDVVLVKASYSDGLWRVAERLHAAVSNSSQAR